jgi:hypothetical protein
LSELMQPPLVGLRLVEEPLSLPPPRARRFEPPVKVGEPVVLTLADQVHNSVDDLGEHDHPGRQPLENRCALGLPGIGRRAVVDDQVRTPLAMGLVQSELVLLILVAKAGGSGIEGV